MRFAEISLRRDIADALEAANLKQRAFAVFVEQKLIKSQRLVGMDHRVKPVGFVADFGQRSLNEVYALALRDLQRALQSAPQRLRLAKLLFAFDDAAIKLADRIELIDGLLRLVAPGEQRRVSPKRSRSN